MSAFTDDIRGRAASIIADAAAIDAAGEGAAWPARIDCLPGPSCLSRGALNVAFDYFEVKTNELQRLYDQCHALPGGPIVVLTDSFGDYMMAQYFSPFMVLLNCYGINFRHVIQMLFRTEGNYTNSDPNADAPGIPGILHEAGAVVLGFGGLIGNAIADEISTAGHTEDQMVANIAYALDPAAGLLKSLGGKLVVCCGTPTLGQDSVLTNHRVYRVNEEAIKPACAAAVVPVVDVNETLAPGWHANAGANMLTQYARGNAHLLTAGYDVMWAGVKASLASIGVPA